MECIHCYKRNRRKGANIDFEAHKLLTTSSPLRSTKPFLLPLRFPPTALSLPTPFYINEALCPHMLLLIMSSLHFYELRPSLPSSYCYQNCVNLEGYDKGLAFPSELFVANNFVPQASMLHMAHFLCGNINRYLHDPSLLVNANKLRLNIKKKLSI